MNAAPRPAIEVNPELPVEVLDLFDKALAIGSRPSRYRHAGDFELDLRRFKGAFENGALPSQRALNSRPRARGSTAVQFGVAATIGLALGSVGVWLLSASAPTSLTSSGTENATLAPLTTDAGFEGYLKLLPRWRDARLCFRTATGNFEIFLEAGLRRRRHQRHQRPRRRRATILFTGRKTDCLRLERGRARRP